jgi:hypothetical protein
VVAATRDLNVRQIYLPWYAILTDDGLENEGLEVFEPPRKKARFGISDISHQCKLAIGSPGHIIQPVCLLVLHVAFWAFQLRVCPSSTGKRRKFCPQTQWNARADTALRAACCVLLGSSHPSFFGRSLETSGHDLALYLCSLTCDADRGSRTDSPVAGSWAEAARTLAGFKRPRPQHAQPDPTVPAPVRHPSQLYLPHAGKGFANHLGSGSGGPCTSSEKTSSMFHLLGSLMEPGSHAVRILVHLEPAVH